MIRRLALCAVPFLLVAVTACGGDDDSPSRAATAVKGDAFCTAATEVDSLATSMGTALFSGDPAAADAALAALVKAGDTAQKLAPTDIEQRVATSIDAFKELQTQLKKYNFDLAAAEADPEVVALLVNEDLEANNDELDAYLSEKCGIAAG